MRGRPTTNHRLAAKPVCYEFKQNYTRRKEQEYYLFKLRSFSLRRATVLHTFSWVTEYEFGSYQLSC